MIRAVLVVGIVIVLAHTAAAYPQFQPSRDITCAGCHVSPDGGGILNENGIATAEQIAWKPGDGEFMYGMDKPSWLALGGDVRTASGLVDHGKADPAFFPMQAELAANVTTHGFTLHAIGGLRRPDAEASPVHFLWSREHYLMWEKEPGTGRGLFVRVGRLMPTFGLRLAEHVVFTQRYGGRPLYGEAYAASVSYILTAAEGHATVFHHDSLSSAVEHGDGGALYLETRITGHLMFGLEGKYSSSDEQHRLFVGGMAKYQLEDHRLQLLGEWQLIRDKIAEGAGDTAYRIAAYLLASKSFDHGLMLDTGIGHYTQDTRVKGLTRDCLDVNLHWFMTSHIEWVLTGRVELLSRGSGPNGGYALAQLHYRL